MQSSFYPAKIYKQSWIEDSGSSSHIYNDKFLFIGMKNNYQNCVTIAKWDCF